MIRKIVLFRRILAGIVILVVPVMIIATVSHMHTSTCELATALEGLSCIVLALAGLFIMLSSLWIADGLAREEERAARFAFVHNALVFLPLLGILLLAATDLGQKVTDFIPLIGVSSFLSLLTEFGRVMLSIGTALGLLILLGALVWETCCLIRALRQGEI